MKKLFCLIPILLIVACSSSKMDMSALNNRTYYAYSYETDGRKGNCFTFLPYSYLDKEAIPMRFKLQFKGDSLHVNYEIFKEGKVLTETKSIKGKLKKDGWKFVSRRLLPFFPVYFYSSVYKVLIYPNIENDMRVDTYSSSGGCLFFFCAGGAGYSSLNTYKNEEDIQIAIPYIENGKFGLKRQGKIIVPASYDHIDIFDKGVARVKKDSLWGTIDNDGKIVIPIEYKVLEKENYTTSKLFLVQKDKHWGFLDEQGNTVLPIIYDVIDRLGSNFNLYLGDKKGYFKYYKGKEDESRFIPACYTDIEKLTLWSNYILVYDGDTILFVDKEGNEYDAQVTEVRKIDAFFGYPQRDNEVKIDGKYYRPNIESKRPPRKE